jgi:YfiH family protein
MPARCIDLAAEPFHDTTLLRFEPLGEIDAFAHVITTRPWNMAVHRGPQADLAAGRRRLLCERLGLPFERLTVPDQAHSPHVVRIHPADLGAGREDHRRAIRFVDGLVCDLPGAPVIQFSADCPLVVVVDPRRRLFGTAHASWRGTVAGITAELVRMLRSEFAADPAALRAAICPCAGPAEYEVGEDVRRVARARLPGAEGFFHDASGRLCFDLRAANVDQLVRSGLHEDHILVAAHSTMTDPRFYSHRRDGENTGRFALIAGFREGPPHASPRG